MHGDLYHDPGRHRPGQHHQHRHRQRDAPERATHQPAVDRDDPGNAAPDHHAREDGRHRYLFLGGHAGHLQLPGRQHRQRDPDGIGGHRPHARPVPGHLPQHLAVPRRLRDVQRATYTTTQADVDRGAIVNTGTASATPPSGGAVSANSTVTVPAVQASGINLEKSANVNSFSAAGTVVTYRYTVTNTGNTTLSQVVVTDPMPRLSAIDCPFTSLAPAGQETCTATYTTTQADVDAGAITNQGTVTGTPPTGPALTDRSIETIDAVQQPAVGLLKTPSIPSFAVAGTAITYTYEVINSGNVTLHAITVPTPCRACRRSAVRSAPSRRVSRIPAPPPTPPPRPTSTPEPSPTPERSRRPRLGPDGHRRSPRPGAGDPGARYQSGQEVGYPSFAAPGIADDLPLPGHQYRQRDPQSGAVTDPMPDLSPINCWASPRSTPASS